MKGLLRLLSVFVLIGIFAPNAWADKPKILQLKDLKPGTHAIGFSVFKGVEPEPFDVELGNTTDNMGNSFILAKISGGPMDTPLEKIGAIAGMSGSPIFVGCTDLDDCTKNGILVGALSYAIGYFIEGGMNCLLTPAEYMLGARTGGYVAASPFSNRMPDKIYIKGREFINLMLFPKMENLRSVVKASGDVRPVAGNSNGRCEESIKSDIKPGSMVSVFLATGTMNVGASGTVTWRDGNNIYIFGHPLNGSGMVQYPFVQVSVADTLQTPYNASKITGCYLDTKGAMFIDGAFEMSGIIGATASMLPYRVELHLGNDGAILSEEIAASPMAPSIIKGLPVVWAQQSLGDISHFSLVYQVRISISDQPEIFVKNMIPAQVQKELKNSLGNTSPFEEVFDRVYSPLQVMKESGFNYGVESIKVHLDLIKDLRLWTEKKSFLSQEKASPGETVYVNVLLEEFFSSATRQMSIPVKVPEDFMERTESGIPPTITILVQGGSKFTDKREPAEITSIEDLIKQLNQSMNQKPNILYVQQIMPKSKAEQKTDKDNAKTAVKPAWKWTDVEEGDLMRLPRDNKNDVVLTFSPALNDFIDLNLTLNLQIQPKDDSVKDKKETKKKKRFLFF